MQRLKPTKLTVCFLAELTFLGLLSCLVAGCDNSTGMTPSVSPKPLQGTSLKFRCSEVRLRSILEPMVRVWSHQSGAQVEIASGPMGPNDASDLAVISFAELGTWADRGELVPIPASLREPGHAYQWSSVLSVYRGEAFAGWGGQLFGLPIAAEGRLMVYRADRFADPQAKAEFLKRFARPLAVPATWEEFADIAAFFSERDKRPSLAPVDGERLDDLFNRVVACYDRPVQTGDGQEYSEGLAFQFRLDTGKARLEEKSYLAAARWLARLRERGCIPPTGAADPASALLEDRAVMGLFTMTDLARLQIAGRVDARYGIAALPGTAAFVNPTTGILSSTKANYVPYFSGGWLGVVRRGCKNPDAAFALLAELGGPTRGQEIIAAGGFGPLRDTHLEPDRTLVWLGYGFDEPRSKLLQEALRSYLGKSVRNPAFGLRTPDGANLKRVLAEELTPTDDRP